MGKTGRAFNRMHHLHGARGANAELFGDGLNARLRLQRYIEQHGQGERPDPGFRIVHNSGARNQGGTAEIHIYDEIGMWGVDAATFMRELGALNVDSIDLRLNSPGGDAFDGIAMYNALRRHRAEVTVYVDALAASAASVIAMAGDRVVMQRASRMMIHEAFGAALGDAQDMRTMAETLDGLSNDIASTYAARAGGSLEEWRDRMHAETWFSAAEAVAAGLADEYEDAPTNHLPARPRAHAQPTDQPEQPAPEHPPVPPVTDPAPALYPPLWTDETTEHFRLLMVDLAANGIEPEPRPEPAPEPAPPAPFDPVQFINAIKEGITT